MKKLKFLFLNAAVSSICIFSGFHAQAQSRIQTPESLTFSQFNITKVAKSPEAALKMVYETCGKIDIYLKHRVQNLNMNCYQAIHTENKTIQTPAGPLFMAIAVFDLFSKRGVSTGEITGKIHFENIRARSLSVLLNQIKSYCGRVQYAQNQKLEQARASQLSSPVNIINMPFKGALICEAQDIDSHFDASTDQWLFESGVLVLDILQARSTTIY